MNGLQFFLYYYTKHEWVDGNTMPTDIAQLIYDKTIEHHRNVFCNMCERLLLSFRTVDLSHAAQISIRGYVTAATFPPKPIASIMRKDGSYACYQLHHVTTCDKDSRPNTILEVLYQCNGHWTNIKQPFSHLRHHGKLYSKNSEEMIQSEKYFTICSLNGDDTTHFCYPCWTHKKRMRDMFLTWSLRARKGSRYRHHP